MEGAKEKVAVAVQGLAGAMVGWVVRAMGGGGVRGSGVAGGLVAAARGVAAERGVEQVRIRRGGGWGGWGRDQTCPLLSLFRSPSHAAAPASRARRGGVAAPARGGEAGAAVGKTRISGCEKKSLPRFSLLPIASGVGGSLVDTALRPPAPLPAPAMVAFGWQGGVTVGVMGVG